MWACEFSTISRFTQTNQNKQIYEIYSSNQMQFSVCRIPFNVAYYEANYIHHNNFFNAGKCIIFCATGNAERK